MTFTISRAGGPGTLGTVAQPSGRTHHQFILSDGAALNWGQDTTSNPAPRGASPAYGVGGIYPRMVPGIEDGVTIRVVDAAMADGSAAFFLASNGFSVAGLALGGIEGDVHLRALGGAYIDMGVATYLGGEATHQVAFPGALGGFVATLAGQCASVELGTGLIKMSSAAHVSVGME